MDFAKAYKQCRKSMALGRGIKAVEACLHRGKHEFDSLQEAKLSCFRDIRGYKIVSSGECAFFPRDLSEIKVGSGLAWYRDTFATTEIVLPPYHSFGFLSEYGGKISKSNSEEERYAHANNMLLEMYTPPRMADLICGAWSQRITFAQYQEQLIEAVKAYCLGLYGVAIVGILPCIEGFLRELGKHVSLPVKDAVNIETLLKVFHRIKQGELKRLVAGYDWYPDKELTINYLSRYHERVQMLESMEMYFRGYFYGHTESLPSHVVLNRHGIAHGFFKGYATPSNFLRLFNLISLLSFAAILVEGRGSMLQPGVTTDSEALALNFTKCLLSRRYVQPNAQSILPSPIILG